MDMQTRYNVAVYTRPHTSLSTIILTLARQIGAVVLGGVGTRPDTLGHRVRRPRGVAGRSGYP